MSQPSPEPSQCNSNNSGVAIYQRGSAQTLSVTPATHCVLRRPRTSVHTTCGGTGGPTVEATVASVTATVETRSMRPLAGGIESPALSRWIEQGGSRRSARGRLTHQQLQTGLGAALLRFYQASPADALQVILRVPISAHRELMRVP